MTKVPRLTPIGLLIASHLCVAVADEPPTIWRSPSTSLDRPLPLPSFEDLPWQVAIQNDRVAVYARPGEVEPMRLPADRTPGYGSRYYVADQVDLPRKMVLLADYERIGAGFRKGRPVGWVDREWASDRQTAITVKEAGDLLDRVLLPTDSRWKWLRPMIPGLARKEHGKVALKVFIDGAKDKRAFRHPIGADQLPEAIATGQGQKLVPFTFAYVHKIVPRDRGIFCLVGGRSEIELARLDPRQFADEMFGWVELSSSGVILWPTRLAVRPDLSAGAIERRKAANDPILIWPDRDCLVAELAGTRPGLAPLFIEDFASPVWKNPFLPEWHHLPVVGVSMEGSRELRQIGLLANSDGIPLEEVEELRSKLIAITEQMRAIEVVLVIDRTSSMGVSFRPLCQAFVEMVNQLRAAAVGVDALRTIEVRVAVMGFWDDPDLHTPRLTEPSPKFYEVMHDKDLREFERYMDRLTENGGGDRKERHYTGIDQAIKTFLTGPMHRPGASPVLVVASDVGPHARGEGSTQETLTMEDVYKLLDPIKAGDAQSTRIALHVVHVQHRPGEASADLDKDLAPLADSSGGSKVKVHLSRDNPSAPPELTRSIVDMIQKRRADIEAAIRSVPRHIADASVTIDYERARRSIEDIVSPDQFERIKKGLAQSYFLVGHTVATSPTDPPGQPRFQTTVMLTYKDMLRIQQACEQIAQEIAPQLVSFKGLKPEDVQPHFKRTIIILLKSALGASASVPESEIRRLMELPLEEIQKEIASLPILIGGLKGNGPATYPEIEAFSTKMARVASRLRMIPIDEPKRLIRGAVATDQLHVYLFEDELP